MISKRIQGFSFHQYLNWTMRFKEMESILSTVVNWLQNIMNYFIHRIISGRTEVRNNLLCSRQKARIQDGFNLLISCVYCAYSLLVPLAYFCLFVTSTTDRILEKHYISNFEELKPNDRIAGCTCSDRGCF